jgi:hypothetical protein
MYLFNTQISQAANGIRTSYDGLVDLLESICHFLGRLSIYTQIPATPTIDEIVIKIMVELLSTLALATKEIKQGRSSKFYINKLPVMSLSVHSKICEKVVWRERHRGSPTEVGPIDAR